MTALTILTHAPYLYLIHTFYSISPYTVLSSLTIDILAIALPARLLRKRSPTHSTSATATAVPNRNLINDTVIIALTSVLGASVYSSAIFTSLKTFLPSFLVTHFDGLRTLEAGYEATLPVLTIALIPVGWAVREFLLDPSLGYEARLTAADVELSKFNPETATLAQTIRYNFWGYEKRTRVLLGRAITMVAMIMVSTTVQTYGRLEGSEFTGAVGYAALWAAPGLLATAAFEWVGGV